MLIREKSGERLNIAAYGKMFGKSSKMKIGITGRKRYLDAGELAEWLQYIITKELRRAYTSIVYRALQDEFATDGIQILKTNNYKFYQVSYYTWNFKPFKFLPA